VAARGAHQNRRPPRKSTPKITTKKDVVGRRVTLQYCPPIMAIAGIPLPTTTFLVNVTFPQLVGRVAVIVTCPSKLFTRVATPVVELITKPDGLLDDHVTNPTKV
jgi:hypothetical protein